MKPKGYAQKRQHSLLEPVELVSPVRSFLAFHSGWVRRHGAHQPHWKGCGGAVLLHRRATSGFCFSSLLQIDSFHILKLSPQTSSPEFLDNKNFLGLGQFGWQAPSFGLPLGADPLHRKGVFPTAWLDGGFSWLILLVR